jgi:ABC-type multidrug transport system ATPase subunit
MSLGALMAFLAYLAMFYTPFSNLAQLTAWLTSFLTASQRVFELLDTTVRIKDNSAARALANPKGAVAFDEVSFGYDRRQPVLKQVSFKIKPGEMVGVVGRSGSGKTTLANLLCRFYDVDEGCVSIDGVDVRELDHHDLRRHVGVVLQEPFLFRGTVGANLAYGRPGATPEEIISAAKAANAHDFILQGALAYDAPLGERGAGLSGGEKQRVSIARALLYDPRILVLDEATSSVDTESERAIQDALRELARGRTTIAIAHRLSTLRDADRILVFDQGRLVEQGSHEELLDADGIYANLVRIQTQLTSEPTIDRLTYEEAPVKGDSRTDTNGKPKTELVEKSRSVKPAAADDLSKERAPRTFEPSWLSPTHCRLTRDDQQTLWLARDNASPTGGVFAVRCFPAERPEEFISLRHADADGQQHELGIIRRMSEWPAEQQALVREALERRYLLHDIRSIAGIRLEHGLLDFEVETDQGAHRFTMRWSQSFVQDFGPRGKLLLDVDDNRWLVADVEALPRRQQLLFRRHVYW